jgi:hypothetical protein
MLGCVGHTPYSNSTACVLPAANGAAVLKFGRSVAVNVGGHEPCALSYVTLAAMSINTLPTLTDGGPYAIVSMYTEQHMLANGTPAQIPSEYASDALPIVSSNKSTPCVASPARVMSPTSNVPGAMGSLNVMVNVSAPELTTAGCECVTATVGRSRSKYVIVGTVIAGWYSSAGVQPMPLQHAADAYACPNPPLFGIVTST